MEGLLMFLVMQRCTLSTGTTIVGLVQLVVSPV
jgi:hypothetical protein